MKIRSAEFVLSAVSGGQLIRDGRPEVAFVGRSNVGKSSLMNRLLNRKSLARTSSTPGRTRAVNYFLIDARYYFVDLPGYGYAKAGWSDRQAWAELIDLYFRAVLEPASGGGSRAQVIQLVDAKVGATELDVDGYRYLAGFGAPVTVAVTKCDRISRGRRGAAVAAVRRTLGLEEDVKAIAISARTGDGAKELWAEIFHHMGADGSSSLQPATRIE